MILESFLHQNRSSAKAYASLTPRASLLRVWFEGPAISHMANVDAAWEATTWKGVLLTCDPTH